MPRNELWRDGLRRSSNRGKLQEARARTYCRPNFKGFPFPVTFKQTIQARAQNPNFFGGKTPLVRTAVVGKHASCQMRT